MGRFAHSRAPMFRDVVDVNAAVSETPRVSSRRTRSARSAPGVRLGHGVGDTLMVASPRNDSSGRRSHLGMVALHTAAN